MCMARTEYKTGPYSKKLTICNKTFNESSCPFYWFAVPTKCEINLVIKGTVPICPTVRMRHLLQIHGGVLGSRDRYWKKNIHEFS